MINTFCEIIIVKWNIEKFNALPYMDISIYSVLTVRSMNEYRMFVQFHNVTNRLAPVLKTIFHQCVISYTCSQSYSDGPVLRQSHQSKAGYKYMM